MKKYFLIFFSIFLLGFTELPLIPTIKPFPINLNDTSIFLIGTIEEKIYSTGDPLSNEIISKDIIFNIKSLSINSAQEIICLSLNIYHEARGDNHQGQIATAFVVKNRVEYSNFPNTYCNVIWQYYKTKKGKYIAQFSWTRDRFSDIPKNRRAWIEAQKLAYLVYMNYDIYDLTEGHLNYYAHMSILPPKWAKGIKGIIIGRHTFLTAKEHLYLP